ncbi:FxLD family lanthipeptide [Embleya sp. NPDC055664]
MRGVTEEQSGPGPLVYGYLRLVSVSAARRRSLVESLHEYCRHHELLLAGVFVEHPSQPAASVAFTGLLDALRASGGYGVLFPSRAHLGGKSVSRERRARITELGARVLLVRTPTSGRRPRRPSDPDGSTPGVVFDHPHHHSTPDGAPARGRHRPTRGVTTMPMVSDTDPALDDDFDLDVRVTTDVAEGVPVPCDTNDTCAATCKSSCVSS